MGGQVLLKDASSSSGMVDDRQCKGPPPGIILQDTPAAGAAAQDGDDFGDADKDGHEGQRDSELIHVWTFCYGNKNTGDISLSSMLRIKQQPHTSSHYMKVFHSIMLEQKPCCLVRSHVVVVGISLPSLPPLISSSVEATRPPSLWRRRRRR